MQSQSSLLHAVYIKYRYFRHEGFGVTQSLKMSSRDLRIANAAVKRYAREWVEGLAESSLSDRQIAKLIWGEVTGTHLIQAERWISCVRAKCSS